MKAIIFISLLSLISCGKDANVNRVLNELEDSKNETILATDKKNDDSYCSYCNEDSKPIENFIQNECDIASSNYDDCVKTKTAMIKESLENLSVNSIFFQDPNILTDKKWDDHLDFIQKTWNNTPENNDSSSNEGSDLTLDEMTENRWTTDDFPT